ncbi:Xylose isomerase [Sesamum angolense]|uniref:Xylose isomerase n=1 Tax=Sesamum angolense TaxID=2727404 RepID=A0AAE2C0G4_9LAMI|nr:Xylose isomerase [Sesamum angolense]
MAAPPTCPAHLGSDCATDEWKGEFFPGIPKIKYEGPSSKNPLAFKWYNAEEEILGKKMKVAIHLVHPQRWPWEDGTNSLAMAKRRMKANFEFIEKLGVDRWCFHDKDIAPDGKTIEARFLEAAVAYKKKIGFNGTLLIEPKPQEPTKHQRRESTDVEDIFIAHIAGMDTLARGLRNAAKLLADGSLTELVRKRYQSFDTELGAQIEAGKGDFDLLEKKAIEWGEPTVASAKQELAEMIFQSAL